MNVNKVASLVGLVFCLFVACFAPQVVSQATREQEFLFTQCDCATTEFDSIVPNGLTKVFDTSFTPFSGTTSITCGDDEEALGNFPLSNGITSSGDEPDGFLEGSVPRSTILEAGAEAFIAWAAVLQFELLAVDDALSTILFEVEDHLQLSVGIISFFSGKGLEIKVSAIDGASTSVETVEVPEVTDLTANYTVVFGYFPNAVGFPYQHAVCAYSDEIDLSSPCNAIGGVAQDPEDTDPVDIKLLSSTTTSGGEASAVRVTYLRVSNDNADVTAVNGLDELDQYASAAATDTRTDTVVIPDTVSVFPTLSTNEDESVRFDLKNFVDNIEVIDLTFTATSFDGTTEVTGSLNNGFDGIVDYTPIPNSEEDDAFNFRYGIQQPYICFTPNISTSIDIVPVNDAPVAVDVPILEVFPGVPTSFLNILVATDVDGTTPNLESGVFEVQGQPSFSFFKSNSGDCDSEIITSVNIDDGLVDFCVTFEAGLQPGQELSALFKIIDDTLEVFTTLRFGILNPVDVEEFAPLEVLEDISFEINFADVGFGVNNVPGEDAHKIKITSLPSDGTLVTTLGTEISVGSEFNSDESIFYAPVEDSFTTNPTGLATDLAGQLIGDCQTRNEDEICIISFNYTVLTADGLIESPSTGTAEILVKPVDDGGVSLDVTPADVELFTSAENPDPEILHNLNGFTLTSDTGNNVFPIDLEIVALDGIEFRYSLDGLSGTVAQNVECNNERCSGVNVTAAPSVLVELVSAMDVYVPVGDDLVDLELFFTATPLSGALDDTPAFESVLFNITLLTDAPTSSPTTKSPSVSPTSEPTGSPEVVPTGSPEVAPTEGEGFFEDQQNIIIVGAAGGGGLILIAAAAFFFTRGGKSSTPEELEAEEKENIDAAEDDLMVAENEENDADIKPSL